MSQFPSAFRFTNSWTSQLQEIEMHSLTRCAIAVVVLCGALIEISSAQTGANNTPQTPQEFVASWNAAYTGLDAKAVAALETPEFELIDRFGHRIQSEGAAFNEQLWAATFKDIYHGRPGPEHTIEAVRMLGPDAALVQAHANWGEIVLDDGTHIPPHGEIATFVLVKDGHGWRAAAVNIHNQISDEFARPGENAPVPAK